ncbi:MAG: hypothetical protein ACE5GW_02350 [Planctomycetota bacterium]
MGRIVAGLLLACVVPALASAQGGAPGRWRKTDLAPPGKFTLGLELERVLARNIDDSGVSGTEFDDTGAFDGTRDAGTMADEVELVSNSLLLRLAYSVYAPGSDSIGVEGYLLAGGSNLKLDGDVLEPGEQTQSFNVDGDLALTYGGGVKARLYSREGLSIFSDASLRLSGHDSNLRKVKNLKLDIDPGESATQDFDTTLIAWQVSAYAAWQVEAGKMTLAPFAGIRLSGVELDVDGDQETFDPAFKGRQTIEYDSRQADILGLFAGVEGDLLDSLSVFLEVRVIDELAVAVGLSYIF